MGEEFKGFEESTPTLTLEPDLGDHETAVAAQPDFRMIIWTDVWVRLLDI